MSLDKSKIKPIPIQKTLSLINNFVISSTSFLNTFTENVEIKISKISNKITELEILLSVLEAKLNSVPGLDITENQPNGQSDKQELQENSPPQQSQQQQDPVTMPVQPNKNDQIPPEDKVKYAEFEKMLKVGVPTFVVEAKVIAAGLDPSLVEGLK